MKYTHNYDPKRTRRMTRFGKVLRGLLKIDIGAMVVSLGAWLFGLLFASPCVPGGICITVMFLLALALVAGAVVLLIGLVILVVALVAWARGVTDLDKKTFVGAVGLSAAAEDFKFYLKSSRNSYAPRGGCVADATSAPASFGRKSETFLRSLSSRWFAFGVGEEFLGLDLVAAAVDWRDEVVFGEEVDEHGEVFVVHDDD